jgi:hydroxyacylglutathione hydrolase
LDCREDIKDGFFNNSINVGLNTPFAVWVGTLIKHNVPLIILADEGRENEAILRLFRIGFENILGYLKGGLKCGLPVVKCKHLNVEEFIKICNSGNSFVLDVRNRSETESGMSKFAKNIPVSVLEK